MQSMARRVTLVSRRRPHAPRPTPRRTLSKGTFALRSPPRICENDALMQFHRKFFGFLLVALLLTPVTAEARLAPNERFSMVSLGMAYLNQWDLDNARKVLDTLRKDSPKDTVVQYYEAQVLFHEGDYKAAEKVIDGFTTMPVIQGVEEFIALVRATNKATAPMRRHQTKHFDIYYLPGRDEILLPYAEETLEKAYERIGADLQFKPTERIRVEIYPDSDSFIAATPLTRQEIETSGTIALCKYNRILITTPRMLVRGYAWRDTLVHEYVHYILSRKSRNQVPLWLHEGIAKFQEQRWRSNEIGNMSPLAESLLAEALEKDYFITLNQMHPSLAKLESAEDTQLAFAQVETMVGFLVRKGGYPKLLKLIDEFTQGANQSVALRNTGGWANVDVFLEEWKAFLSERGLKKVPGRTVLQTTIKDNGDSEDREDLQSVQDETARKHVRLGDMLRDRERFAAAAYQYERAREASPGVHPVLLHKLGLAYMRADKLDQAQAVLESVVKVYPQYGPANLRLGEIHVKRSDYARARDYLEQAVGVNPFDPAVHTLLLQVYRQLDEKELVKREQKVLSILRR